MEEAQPEPTQHRSATTQHHVIVACATDRRFTQLAGVMLASLFDKGEVGSWRVMVFGYRLRDRDKARICLSAGSNGALIDFVDVDPTSPLLKSRMPTRFALSPAPYVRLLIPELLGYAAGRLVYLDADTLVLSSLQPLKTFDMQGCALAAVEDHASTHPANRGGEFLFAADAPYFNSGVLLFDLERWGSLDLTRRAFEFIEAHEGVIDFPDQDALNCVLDGKWVALPPEWNFTHHRATAAGGYKQAHVVHFTGVKPWSADCRHTARELYLHYRASTPWRHKRLTTRFERRMGKSLHKRAVRFRRWRKKVLQHISAGSRGG